MWQRTLIILWISFLLSSCAHLNNEKLGYVLHTVDCLQTREVFRNPKFVEANPLIKSWQQGCIMGYGVHYGMNQTELKDQWNPAFNFWKGLVILHNKKLGVEIDL